jgi:hypothetical protein
MSALAAAINLQFGKSTLCYQDVICEGFSLARILPQISLRNLRKTKQKPVPTFAEYAAQIIPNSRGSHSEISGM